MIIQGITKVIFAANNSVDITGTIDGASAGEGIIQVTGATKTFKSAIGSTSVGTLDIDATPVFESTVGATTIDIAGSVTATFNDAITATTIALNGSSNLTISYTGAITVAGNITDTSTSNEINVLFATADTAPSLVTFSGAAVAADTINIGSTTKAGKATFTGSTGVTATTLTIAGGNHANEDSTATFNDDLTATIVLDDNTGDAKIIFATANNATITGTINGSATTEGTLQITGATKTFASIIGGTQDLTLIDIDGTSIFNAAVSATDIDNDGTATFKSNVTAATANDGTLTLTPNGNNNITHTGAITGSGTLNAVEADDGAVNSVTFSTDVTAGTFNVGSTTKSGVVILNGDTTVTNLNIYGGDANAEDSTVTVNGDLDTTTTTLDDGTNSAVTKIIFADSDTVTISGAITAATANDGTIQVTGANKTFSGTIGGTRIGTLDIDETSTYTGAVTVNNLDIAANKTATFKNDVTLNTSATINSSATFLVASAGTPAAITVAGSVLGASDGVGTVQITNTGGTTFSGTVGNTANTLALINIDQDTTFSGSVEATDINNAASTTATFSDNVTATITNSGTLLFDATDAKSVTGTIAEAAGGDTTEVQVINSANGEAPSVVTFTGTVAADTLTIGTTTHGGAALFEEAVTVPTINITGANSGDENSTATFNKAVTATTIVLDNSGVAGTAKIIFAANNSVTITGTINGFKYN
jgi:hypothetical protein